MKQTKAQLRVAIAKDVVKQIKNKKYIGHTCFYATLNNLLTPIVDLDASLQDLINKSKKNIKCEVCVLGACFVSLIGLKNEISVKDFMGKNDIYFYDTLSTQQSVVYENLKNIFPPTMMTFIETAYAIIDMINPKDYKKYKKLSSKNRNYIFYYPYLQRAIRWGNQKKYNNNSVRILAIMKNIIKNKGQFIIPKKFHSLKEVN